jgi:D-xylulose reductase
MDLVGAQTKAAGVETIFRSACMCPSALALLGSDKIHIQPLITDRHEFQDSIAVCDHARNMKPIGVTVQIALRAGG